MITQHAHTTQLHSALRTIVPQTYTKRPAAQSIARILLVLKLLLLTQITRRSSLWMTCMQSCPGDRNGCADTQLTVPRHKPMLSGRMP
jgi:hypothetical protein